MVTNFGMVTLAGFVLFALGLAAIIFLARVRSSANINQGHAYLFLPAFAFLAMGLLVLFIGLIGLFAPAGA